MKKTSFVSLTIFGFILMLSACTHKATPTVAAAPAPVVKEETIANAFVGELTYKSSCGRCHDLKNPASYTANEWGPIMNSMAVKAKLTTQQKADVTAYVLNNARSVK